METREELEARCSRLEREVARLKDLNDDMSTLLNGDTIKLHSKCPEEVWDSLLPRSARNQAPDKQPQYPTIHCQHNTLIPFLRPLVLLVGRPTKMFSRDSPMMSSNS